MLGRTRRIHLVGIGGTGMSGIAEVLLNLGYEVSGSDLHRTDVTRRLAALGGVIVQGHRPENVGEADVVVISSAIAPDNPEILAARAARIPVIPRAAMLAELMRVKYGVAVGGAHGKTTTTWLTGLVLDHGGLDPTIVVGGRVKALRTGARLGKGEFLVAEADESDGSFLALSPTVAVVTNIAPEHLDYYRDLDAIREAFVAFMNRVPFYGAVVACADDENVRGVLPLVEKKVLTYGTRPEAIVRATHMEPRGFSTAFRVEFEGRPLGEVEVRLAGARLAQNALAAVAVGIELGVPFDRIREALAVFSGIARRMEVHGEAGGVLWMDDYGHHPDEVAATLAGAREIWTRRLVVVFQPHRYTRVAALAEAFGPAFDRADHVLIAEIYPAGEKPIPGVSGEQVAQAVRDQGRAPAEFIAGRDTIVARLRDLLRPGDVLITMGAGDIWKVGEEILRGLRRASRAGGEE